MKHRALVAIKRVRRANRDLARRVADFTSDHSVKKTFLGKATTTLHIVAVTEGPLQGFEIVANLQTGLHSIMALSSAAMSS